MSSISFSQQSMLTPLELDRPEPREAKAKKGSDRGQPIIIHVSSNLSSRLESLNSRMKAAAPFEEAPVQLFSIGRGRQIFLNDSSEQVELSSRRVFCPPLPGKPDPKEPKPLGPDTRHRVVQKKTKDHTCWYGVFNIMRERYKAPNTSKLAERQFEQRASMRRKEIYNSPSKYFQFSEEDGQAASFFSQITKKDLKNPKKLEKILNQIIPSKRQYFKALIPAFLESQCHNMKEYVIIAQQNGCLEINLRFFSESGIDVGEFYSQQVKLAPEVYTEGYAVTKFKDLPLSIKSGISDTLAVLISAQFYGLKVSSWHPRDPIDSLINELEMRGPLAIGGNYGTALYDVAPHNLGLKIQGREIFGWSKSDSFKASRIRGHMILVVGAEKSREGGFVYYIDPNFESDPLHPEKQPIFRISYEELTLPENISSVHGFLRKEAPEALGYAFYRDRPDRVVEREVPRLRLEENSNNVIGEAEALLMHLSRERQAANAIGLRSILV